MSKKNVKNVTTQNPTAMELATTITTDEEIDKELSAMLVEAKSIPTQTDITGMKVTEIAPKGKKQPHTIVTPKVNEPKTNPYEKKQPITIEGNATLTQTLPEIVTVKDIIGLFANKFDGKFIRRHIRNKFIIGGIRKLSEDNSSKYQWAKNDPQLIQLVTYFTGLCK